MGTVGSLRHWVMVALVSAALLSGGCSTTGSSSDSSAQPYPEQRVEMKTITRTVIAEGARARPHDRAGYLGSTEGQAVSFVRLANVIGPTDIEWRWYDPSGELYVVSAPHAIGASDGAFRESVSAWHALNIAGEPAADRIGIWNVEILLDGQPTARSSFSILEGVATDAPIEGQVPVRPKDWALVIGIEDYSTLPAAAFAKRDAELMTEHAHKLLGVPKDQIITVVNEQATKGSITGYLRRYLPSNMESGGRLYVYYSGHGFPEPGTGRPFLVPHDGNPRFLAESSYALDDLYADLDKVPSAETVVFLDACFSGTSRDPGKALIEGMRPGLLTVRDVATPSTRVVSLTSATASQISHSYDTAGHGLFTYYLLRGLRGEADDNGDGAVDLAELYEYTAAEVGRQSRREGFEQTPSLNPDLGQLRRQPVFPLTLTPAQDDI